VSIRCFTRELIVACGFSILLLGFGSIGPARAFDTRTLNEIGSLPFDRLSVVIRNNSEALDAEVKQRLTEIGRNVDEVPCYGMRFSSRWKNLKGFRASPYVCEFDGKWLKITADVQIYGQNRQRFDRISKSALKRAISFEESNFSWQWTDKNPDND